jgi:hypothetical protein
VLRRAILDTDGRREPQRGGIAAPPPVRDQPQAAHTAPVLSPARYVLLPLAQMLTGYSVKAMQRKIERGNWQEGKVWKHAPDGHIVIDMVGYHKWVENP